MARQPDFLAKINDCQCSNISTHMTQLEPTIDLATLEKQQSLTYVLDVFPGLYFERVDAEHGRHPRVTTNKPVLIVSTTPRAFRNRTNPSGLTALIREPQSIMTQPSAAHITVFGDPQYDIDERPVAATQWNDHQPHVEIDRPPEFPVRGGGAPSGVEHTEAPKPFQPAEPPGAVRPSLQHAEVPKLPKSAELPHGAPSGVHFGEVSKPFQPSGRPPVTYPNLQQGEAPKPFQAAVHPPVANPNLQHADPTEPLKPTERPGGVPPRLQSHSPVTAEGGIMENKEGPLLTTHNPHGAKNVNDKGSNPEDIVRGDTRGQRPGNHHPRGTENANDRPANAEDIVMENSEEPRSTIHNPHPAKNLNDKIPIDEGKGTKNGQKSHSTTRRPRHAKDKDGSAAVKYRYSSDSSSRCILSRHPKDGVRSSKARRERRERSPRRLSAAGCGPVRGKAWWRELSKSIGK